MVTENAPVTLDDLNPGTSAPESVEEDILSTEEPAAPEGDESESTAPAKQSLDDLIEADEEYKGRFEERLKERESEAYFKAQEEIVKRAPEIQEWTRAANRMQGELAKAQQAIPQLVGSIQDAIASGDADLLATAFRKNPSAWTAISMLADANVEQRVAAARQQWETEELSAGLSRTSWGVAQDIVAVGSKVAGSSDLARDFAAKLVTDAKSGGNGQDVMKDFFTSLIDVGYKRGLKERGHVSAETDKARSRSGQGPDTTEKGVGRGRGGPISSMADADRRYNLPSDNPEYIGHDAYREARKRFGVD